MLHRGPGVYGEAWRARANVCSFDSKYDGWAQGNCFSSVLVCSYDVEWHLFLRSVPRLSRGERLMQVLEGGWTFFLSKLHSLCCSFPEYPVLIMGRPMFSNVMTKCLFTRDLIWLPSRFQSSSLGVFQEQVHRLKLCSWESERSTTLTLAIWYHSSWEDTRLYYTALPVAKKLFLFTLE